MLSAQNDDRLPSMLGFDGLGGIRSTWDIATLTSASGVWLVSVEKAWAQHGRQTKHNLEGRKREQVLRH